jgi:amino acid adenylation domain-containing protein
MTGQYFEPLSPAGGRKGRISVGENSLAYRRDLSVTELFEERALADPAAVALVVPREGASSERLITYGELDALAAATAARLGEEGVSPGDFVAVLMNRSPELIVSLLGILKAGAAYVPLDPSYPAERLEFMLADSGAAVCVADPALAGAAERRCRKVLRCGVESGPGGARAPAPSAPRTATDPAYVIYTSGSTGRPKGVVVPHRAIARLVLDQTYARFDSSRVFLQLAPVSFDAATFEIWGPLLNGGRCVIAPQAGVPDLERLGAVIRETGVTTLWLTASLFNTIVDQAAAILEPVAEVLAGGEALSVPHVRRAQQLLPAVQLVNGYGPTETTTFACCYRIPRPLPEQLASIPIGPPIAHSTAFVLDEALREAGPGVEGDLYLGGDGVALGYLNLPELTAAHFVAHPLAGEGTLYATGDRARMLPDGALEFLGRRDGQVKIRGYRVELGEVESALRSAPGVADAVVTLREDIAGEKRLAAYYTAGNCAAPPPARALQDHLSRKLPDYMVPSYFVVLDAIPLTPNGKADRGALPSPSRRRPMLERALLAPRTALETWLAGLWREVLMLDEVGVEDRFFELGGTSLTAMRFLARLNTETRAPLPALVLFRAPTIAQLAGILEREYRHELPPGLLPGPERAAAVAPPLAERAARQREDLAQRRRARRGMS